MMKKNRNKIEKTSKIKTIALTGGKTMGHISPNLALLEDLKKHYERIIYIGESNSMEEKKAKEYGLDFYVTESIKFNRKNLLSNLKIPFKLIKAKCRAKKILIDNNVQTVLSKGGYVSLPTILASQKLNIPNILHESDMSLGLANRVAAKKASKILVSTKRAYDGLNSKLKKKAEIVGIPVSNEFKYNKNNKNVEKLRNVSNKKIMLITGGSQGSKAINDIIRKNIDKLTQDYFVYHIVGKNNIDQEIKNKDYKQIEFTSNMADYLHASDIIISRGGATTIFEGLFSNANMLIIPLPKSKHSRGDQVENAKYFFELGLIEYIEEKDLSLESLERKINLLNTTKEKRIKNIENFTKSLKSNQEIAKIISGTH